MESVEREIRPVVRHKHDKQSEKSAEADACPEPYPAACEENCYQKHGKHRAVDIREVIAAFRGSIAVERAGKDIPEIEIACDVAGKFVLSSRRFTERYRRRHKYPHGKHSAHCRGPDEPDEIFYIGGSFFVGCKTSVSLVVFKCPHSVPKHKENADHVADVII